MGGERSKRIGIDLGGTKIEGIVLEADGQVSQTRRVPSPSHSYAAMVQAIADLVAELEGDGATSTPVGIGTPGAWLSSTQTMKNCNSVVLNGQPLLTDLQALLGPRVKLANDANCFALSEAHDGAGRDAKVVFGVILGTGVGGGLVVDGAAWTGPNALAGEWGHTPLAYLRHAAGESAEQPLLAQADRPCYCGRINCVETFLSGPGLERSAQECLGQPLQAADVFERPQAHVLVEQYLTLLAASLAQVINIVDPDVIVLGGGVSAQPVLYKRLPELLPAFVFGTDAATPVLPPVFGDSSGVRGAARLWPLDAPPESP